MKVAMQIQKKLKSIQNVITKLKVLNWIQANPPMIRIAGKYRSIIPMISRIFIYVPHSLGVWPWPSLDGDSRKEEWGFEGITQSKTKARKRSVE
jgi:hypothetical protein